MLKAIVTVLDENDRILQVNRLIFETDSKPTVFGFGIEHEFNFKVVTTDDEELIDKFNKSCEGFTIRADEIREAWKNNMDIDDGGK